MRKTIDRAHRILVSGQLPSLLSVAGEVAAGTALATCSQPVSRVSVAARKRAQILSGEALRLTGNRGTLPTTPLDSARQLVRLQDLGWTDVGLAEVRSALRDSPAVTIGRFDQDGLLLPLYEPVAGIPSVTPEEFMPRKRFTLDLAVTADEAVVVRKTYAGQTAPLLREYTALRHLHAVGCSVPACLAVDFAERSLVMSYIPGQTLREALVGRGARLRDCDVPRHPDLASLSPEQQRTAQIGEGRRFLDEVVDEAFIDEILEQVHLFHRHRFCSLDIKYGNIIIEATTGRPFFVDFENAVRFKSLSWAVRVRKDEDIEDANLHFGRSEPTRRSLAATISSRSAPGMSEIYAPAYLGAGLRIGPVLKSGTGYGRWRYMLREHLPPWQGRRVLDLGANNAFYCMQMLHEGARAAVALERNAGFIAQGRFVKSAFEWRDDREYDLTYVQADFGDLPSLDLGRFDFVMALCCLYYLDDQDIARVVRHVSTISDSFVVQCNQERDIGRTSEDEYRKASVEYMLGVLTANGFDISKVVSPRGYHRPLIVARRTRGFEAPRDGVAQPATVGFEAGSTGG